jgi:hypothetical protein
MPLAAFFRTLRLNFLPKPLEKIVRTACGKGAPKTSLPSFAQRTVMLL